jgi:hypothetical protein
MMLDLGREIKSMVHEFLHPKPRAVCICGDPRPGELDHLYWARCQNCGDWLSRLRCVEDGIPLPGRQCG